MPHTCLQQVVSAPNHRKALSMLFLMIQWCHCSNLPGRYTEWLFEVEERSHVCLEKDVQLLFFKHVPGDVGRQHGVALFSLQVH